MIQSRFLIQHVLQTKLHSWDYQHFPGKHKLEQQAQKQAQKLRDVSTQGNYVLCKSMELKRWHNKKQNARPENHKMNIGGLPEQINGGVFSVLVKW